MTAQEGNLDRWLPHLPESWAIHQLQEQIIDGKEQWYSKIYRPIGTPRSASGRGRSPREAVLRALDAAEAEYGKL